MTSDHFFGNHKKSLKNEFFDRFSFFLILFFIIFSFSSTYFRQYYAGLFYWTDSEQKINLSIGFVSSVWWYKIITTLHIQTNKQTKTKNFIWNSKFNLKIEFLKSKPGTLRNNFPKLFTDDFIDQFNWDGIGKNKFSIKSRVFISHILYGLCFYDYYH